MEQFEQLLTCAICLDRYRNPKLLPCQHSFCMEPCMDGLVDYVRRQVKCPECRAEHRIPYQGVQAFPTNVTLQRFLELHSKISGELPDPTAGQFMERCGICSEKAYCGLCAHCEKKVCPDCKEAHNELLRREIGRINNQIRRALPRLEESVIAAGKGCEQLRQNSASVAEEVEELFRRLLKTLKDRGDFLKGEVDRYMCTEMRALAALRDNLDQELSNIKSNCEMVEKHVSEPGSGPSWDDLELMDTKDILLRTMEFLRSLDFEPALSIGDYSRRVRFNTTQDSNVLATNLANLGDLSTGATIMVTAAQLAMAQPQPPSVGGLARSKSDHRLAAAGRQDDRSGYGYHDPDNGRLSPNLGRRRERYGMRDADQDISETERKHRFRSRFARHLQDNDSDNEGGSGGRSVRFQDQEAPVRRERERVIDTQDTVRGPLSGVSRMMDCAKVMQRLQEMEMQEKRKGKEPDKPAPPVAPQMQPVPPVQRPIAPARRTQRQISEDDEVARQKRENKVLERDRGPDSNPPRATPPCTVAPRDSSLVTDSDQPVGAAANVTTPARKPRANSTDSSRSSSSDTSSSKSTGAVFTTEEVKKRYLANSGIRKESTSSAPQSPTIQSPKSTTPLQPQSRFLGRGPAPVSHLPSTQGVATAAGSKAPPPPGSESSDSSSDSDSSSSDTDEPVRPSAHKHKGHISPETAKTDIGPLLARSAQARDPSTSSPIMSPTSKTAPRRDSLPQRRLSLAAMEDDPGGFGPYRDRYRERDPDAPGYGRKHSESDYAPPDYRYNRLTGHRGSTSGTDRDRDFQVAEPPQSTARSRITALRDRKAKERLARSRSSHELGFDDDDESELMAAYAPPPSTTTKGDIARSRSTHALKAENSPDHEEKTEAPLSSWARYLRSKYGNKTADPYSSSFSSGGGPSTSGRVPRSRSSAGINARRESLESSDDDGASAKSPRSSANFGGLPRNKYLQKRRLLFKFGSRGSEAGNFTWPRGVAAGADNGIVVADSSNHRVQMFDFSGRFVKEFGSYGNAEGEFDCLAGIAVNRIGQIITADRYNHRVQVFDPAGRFLRQFGSQGASDGKFNYPWGVTTDALGFIYVCDKENHRIQVFQSDGTFVGKFGSEGNRPGQLLHPHYIGVSSTNRVIVADTNNHRIQVFDVNGKVLASFGTEGSDEGQFKFPKGVALDDQGYIFIADSGNNRIQMFHPDGSFMRAFGCWGSGDGEFKGLEGIAVAPSGNVLVCDRENHRIQVF